MRVTFAIRCNVLKAHGLGTDASEGFVSVSGNASRSETDTITST